MFDFLSINWICTIYPDARESCKSKQKFKLPPPPPPPLIIVRWYNTFIFPSNGRTKCPNNCIMNTHNRTSYLNIWKAVWGNLSVTCVTPQNMALGSSRGGVNGRHPYSAQTYTTETQSKATKFLEMFPHQSLSEAIASFYKLVRCDSISSTHQEGH